MDPKLIESELRSHTIRQGPIYKRTKFLNQWRQRWMVLTMNYIFIFTNRNMKEVTQYLDLRQVKSYKSYLRKDDDMIPAGFKIRTKQDMFYFCARNCNQKWSWIVSIQRLMDFKYTGKSAYNNTEFIKTKGFMGQSQFQKGRFDSDQIEKPKLIVNEQKKSKQQPIQNKLDVSESQRLNFNKQKQQLKLRQEQVLRKQKQMEQLFIFQLNKLKKSQQELKQMKLQLQQKNRQIQNQKQKIKQKQTTLEQLIKQQKQANSQSSNLQKSSTQNTENKQIIQTPKAKQQKIQQIPIKKQEKTIQQPKQQKRQILGQRVSDMKKLYQSMQQSTKNAIQNNLPIKNIKQNTKKQQVPLHLCRDRVVVNLFQQFHSKSFSYGGLRAIMEFLVKISAERSLGYQQYLVRQSKSHENRFLFAQVLLQFINDFNDYKQSSKLAKIIQILIFQAPGIFKLNHFDLIKRKLIDILYHIPQNNKDLNILIKTMYIVHKMKKFEKNQQLKKRLTTQLNLFSSQQSKNWARKIIQDI